MLQVSDQARLDRTGSAAADTATAPQPATAHDLAGIVVPAYPLSRRIRGWLAWAAIFAVLAWAWAPAEMFRVVALFTDWRNMAQFGAAFLRPNFHDWDLYLADMIVTVQIAIWGTALAVVFGIPFSILGAANICPQWVVQPVRRLMDACRAINEIVFALMFVVAVGLGPFAGVMAIFVHNLGVFAKLFSEAVEAVDPRPVEGIRGDRRAPAAGSGVRGDPPGPAALELAHALPARNQRALGDDARHRRRRRDRPDTVRKHPQFSSTPRPRPRS